VDEEEERRREEAVHRAAHQGARWWEQPWVLQVVRSVAGQAQSPEARCPAWVDRLPKRLLTRRSMR